MEIKSDFRNNERIPEKYTADGDDVNPRLEILGIPDEAKSLVLIVDDPDAQKVVGYTWIHWVVFNIPVSGDKVIIGENSIPGDSGKSTYGKAEYGGPNPPAGTGEHHYHFKVYALDITLDLDSSADVNKISSEMEGYVLDSAELIGIYSR
ncbi:MAG: YbhB/YbcL family Raf kinase inhibitor-like protein [Nanoarchaeota archaeon]|nr:YbhB/YbcL family Raf kinase inhibitor-like protein [Nanoarchaeota archaeon]